MHTRNMKMGWRKDYNAEQSFNERHPQFENQTNLMKNIVQTESGEIVEIINGTLECPNTKEMWLTIAEWMSTEIIDGATIKVCGRGGDYLNVDFPASVPVSKMESLLEHFTYQS